MNKKNRNNNDKFRGADRAFAESVAQRTGAIIRETLLPEGKISDILCEYAQPLVEEFAETDQDHIDVLHLASGLWNMALMKTINQELFPRLGKDAPAELGREPVEDIDFRRMPPYLQACFEKIQQEVMTNEEMEMRRMRFYQ